MNSFVSVCLAASTRLYSLKTFALNLNCLTKTCLEEHNVLPHIDFLANIYAQAFVCYFFINDLTSAHYYPSSGNYGNE